MRGFKEEGAMKRASRPPFYTTAWAESKPHPKPELYSNETVGYS
jgi:hypothetical protein